MKNKIVFDEEDDFNRLVKKLIKQKRKYFVVCRNTYTDELFYIQFKTKKQLERFLIKNHGDIYEIGFYAQGIVNGGFYDDNT